MRCEVVGLLDGVTHDIINFKCDTVGAEVNDVVVVGPEDQAVEVTKGKKNEVSFTSTDPGFYTVSVTVTKRIKLTPPICTVHGTAVQGGDARKSASFVIDSGLTCGDHLDDIEIRVENPNGGKVAVGKLNDKRDGSYTGGLFKPKVPGYYKIEVLAFGVPAKGSPFEALFYTASRDKCFANGVGVEGGDDAEVGSELEFVIHARDAEDKTVTEGPEAFKALVRCLANPDAEPEVCDIREEGFGEYLAVYTANEPGEHEVIIELYGKPLSRCPYQLDIFSSAEKKKRKRPRSPPPPPPVHQGSSRSRSRSDTPSTIDRTSDTGAMVRCRSYDDRDRSSSQDRGHQRQRRAGESRRHESRSRSRSPRPEQARKRRREEGRRDGRGDSQLAMSRGASGNVLYIKGYPLNFRKSDVERLCDRYHLVNIDWNRSGRDKTKHCFVTFRSPEDAYRCMMDLHGHQIDGHPLIVEPRGADRKRDQFRDALQGRLGMPGLPLMHAGRPGYNFPLPGDYFPGGPPVPFFGGPPLIPLPGRRDLLDRNGGGRSKRSKGKVRPYELYVADLPHGVAWQELKDWAAHATPGVDFADVHGAEGTVAYLNRRDLEHALNVLPMHPIMGRRVYVSGRPIAGGGGGGGGREGGWLDRGPSYEREERGRHRGRGRSPRSPSGSE